MTRRWPDSLPQTTSEGFSLSPVDQSIRTDMEVGPQRVRRRTLSNLDRVQMGWIFTDAEMAAFRAWYEDGRWSISGTSDSVAGWTLLGLTRSAGAALSPDLVPVDRLLESAVENFHRASLALTEAAADGVPVILRASFRAAGRSAVRFGLVDRVGTYHSVTVDLETGAQSGISGSPISTRVEGRGDGWWRVTVSASTGAGADVPQMRLGLQQAVGVNVYMGDAGLGVDVCETQARVLSGYDEFLPCDAAGNALGAAGGSAWFMVPIATGGGLRVAEARFAGPYSSQAGAGLNWRVSAQLEVRNA